MKVKESPVKKKSISTLALALGLSWLTCIGYVFMEWLFFVTKPSILSYYTVFENLSVLFVGPLIVLAGLLPMVLVFALPGMAAGGAGKFQWLSRVVPALVLAAAALLLLENFTYTVFGFNVGAFTGLARYAYGLGFVLAAAAIGWKIHQFVAENDGAVKFIGWATVLTGVPALVFAALAVTGRESPGMGAEVTGGGRMPNILIFSSDGINARSMSAYGYERETTPFIESLLEESLLFENHFTNAANTTGSVISLLTGRLPASTRVIYPPDTLRGADSYRHLPGILRKLGYTNGDISIRRFADSEDLNLLEGFDFINGRRYGGNGWSDKAFSLLRDAFPSESLFLNRSYQRISARLFHMAGIRDMENPYLAVTEPERRGGVPDDRRMEQLREFIAGAKRPFFLHVHLLDSHGPRFRPQDPLFSRGREQNEDFMVDFYDDAIRDYDVYVRRAVDFLKNHGLYENTLLILNTDHGGNSYEGRALPLIMRFPGRRYTGTKSVASQRIDIAPTILDYLSVAVPRWMEGDSLLSLPEDARRRIFATANGATEINETGAIQVADPVAPLYTLGRFSLIDCQDMYTLYMQEQRLTRSVISEYAFPCPRNELLTYEEALAVMLSHLEEKGYDMEGFSFRYPKTNWLEYFSGSGPVLRNGILYLPAVEYRGERYAAVLRQSEEDEAVFEVIEVEFIQPEANVPTYDGEINVLRIETVKRGENDYSSLSLRRVHDGPLRFIVEWE